MSEQDEKTMLAVQAQTAPQSKTVTQSEASAVDVASEQASTAQAPVEQNDKMPLLKVEGLKKYFAIQTNFFGKPTRYLRAVDDISFDVDTGKTIGVVGESGCGKTTLGRTILKLYDINGGKIYFGGEDITDLKKSGMQKHRTDIQLIFQDPYSSLPPRMTVGSIIAEPVKVHKIVPKDQVHSYVLDIMKKCGVKPQHYDRYPHEFSGGQRQRICIARALAVKPKLVICDEPVSALDVSIQAQIINLLKELQQTMGLAYVFISHDLSVVKYITDKILVMYLGNAMELSETEELFENPLHPYTKALFSAVPAPDPNVKMNRIVLEGDIPSPANPPSGCKFHTRCSECMKVCKYKVPEYIEVGKDHYVACHLYNKEIMSHLSDYDDEYDRLEEQKRIEQEQAAAKKQNSRITKILGKITDVRDKLFRRNKTSQLSPTAETTATETPSDQTLTSAETETVQRIGQDAAENIEKPETVETVGTPAETQSEAVVSATSEEVKATNSERSAETTENAEAAATDTVTQDVKSDVNENAEVKPTAKRTTRSTTAKSTSTKSASAKKTGGTTKTATAKKSATAAKSDTESAEEKPADEKPATTAKKSATTKSTKTASSAKSSATASKSTNAGKSTTAGKSTSSTSTTKSTASKSTTKSTSAAKSTTAKKTTAARSTTAKKTATKQPTAEEQVADAGGELSGDSK